MTRRGKYTLCALVLAALAALTEAIAKDKKLSDASQLYVDAGHYRVQLTQEGTPEDSDRSITYSPDGAAELDGWYIHLTLYPMHANEESSGYSGSPQEAIELFYGR